MILEEPPEPEPESQNWHEPPMDHFFTDEQLGEMYRECQEWDYGLDQAAELRLLARKGT